MTWDPSQPRLPSGQSGGGEWGAQAKSKSSKSSKGSAKSPPKLGTARNASAAKIQQDKQAQQLYQQAMGMDATSRAVYVKKLPPDQLGKLTEILYSSPTSDKTIVAARIAVANEMSRRGLDVKKYGALGGGSAPARKATPAAKAVAHARVRKVAAKPAPK